MSELIKYDAARKALAEVVRVDEAKAIRDKALAVQAYARQAKDTQLIDYSTEIRLRAERKTGELLRDTAKSGERKGDGRPKKRSRGATVSKLADLGVTKTQSSRWQKLAAEPERAFEKRVAKAKRLAVASVEGSKEVIKEARAEQQAEKRERRKDREQQLADKVRALPGDKKFGVIAADPEWQFEPWSRETGMDRAAANHYPTSVLAVIEERDVRSIAADDCVLFLWATIPMLPHALTVMAAWDFDYVSHYAWKKDTVGTGYWSREKHELLLIGTRGKVPCPSPGTQWDSVIDAHRGDRHSAKPEAVLEMIEQYFPSVPKIELNRRGPARPGWWAWGNEAEQGEQDAA